MISFARIFTSVVFFFPLAGPVAPLTEILSLTRSPQNNFIPCDTIRLEKKIYHKTRNALEVTFSANLCMILTLTYHFYDSRKNWGKFVEKEQREMWKWPLVLRWVYIERWNATCAQGIRIYPRPQGDGCAQSNKEVPALGGCWFLSALVPGNSVFVLRDIISVSFIITGIKEACNETRITKMQKSEYFTEKSLWYTDLK